MRAGRLRHAITIQANVVGSPQRTPSGEINAEWGALHTGVPAEWNTLRGNALFAAQQHHAEIVGIWRLRWIDGITGDMRILHDGLYYQILFVPPYDRQGRRFELELECSAGVIVTE